jgi:hypothetical protein
MGFRNDLDKPPIEHGLAITSTRIIAHGMAAGRAPHAGPWLHRATRLAGVDVAAGRKTTTSAFLKPAAVVCKTGGG